MSTRAGSDLRSAPRPTLLVAALLAGFLALMLGPGTVAGQSVPSVTSVAVTSAPAGSGIYGPGEVIRVTLTFSEAVNVGGEPRLKIDMDPASWGEKWAIYEEGTGTATLVFAHTVVEPNFSSRGIAVLVNTLELNGGAIRSVLSGADAALAHAGLDHDPNHRVDWQRTAPIKPRSPADAVAGAPAISKAGRKWWA